MAKLEKKQPERHHIVSNPFDRFCSGSPSGRLHPIWTRQLCCAKPRIGPSIPVPIPSREQDFQRCREYLSARYAIESTSPRRVQSTIEARSRALAMLVLNFRITRKWPLITQHDSHADAGNRKNAVKPWRYQLFDVVGNPGSLMSTARAIEIRARATNWECLIDSREETVTSFGIVTLLSALTITGLVDFNDCQSTVTKLWPAVARANAQ